MHKEHRSPGEMVNKKVLPSSEVPERIEAIVKEFQSKGLGKSFISPEEFSLQLIQTIHHKNYIEYIRETSEALKKDDSYYPSHYIMDTYTPIVAGTYKAAIEAVNCVLTGASTIDHENIIYALCRPPGHHAENNVMGGYCYFNNTAIAAEMLSQKGKVAILDIDFHHGNGTQRIFYDRSDVLYVSLHADPKVRFPYISGFEEEVGIGTGKDYNYNFPMPLGTTNEAYEKTLQYALQIIKKYQPQYLLVSCGFDTYEHDPIGGFALTIPFYETVARHIMSLKLPTLVVQEGGYHVDDLGKIAYSFYKGLV